MAKMVMAFVIVFAVCFFPQHVFMLWFYIHPTAQQDYNVFWHYFRILGFCLAFTNSCINPIALYCVSSTFRKYFDRYFSTKKRKKNTHTHTYISSISSIYRIVSENRVSLERIENQFRFLNIHGSKRNIRRKFWQQFNAYGMILFKERIVSEITINTSKNCSTNA